MARRIENNAHANLMRPTSPQPAATHSPGDEVTLRDVIEIAFRRLAGMTVIFVLAMAIALVWIFAFRVDTYEATAKILVRLGYEQTPSVTVMSRQTPVVGYRYQEVATEAHILASTDVLERVVDQLNLTQMSEQPRPTGFLSGLVYDLRRLKARLEEWVNETLIRFGLRERLSQREQIIDALQRGLQVGSSQESNVLVAMLRLPYRQGTAAVLDAILQAYLEARTTYYQEDAAVNLFKTRMDEALAKLRATESELKQLETRHSIVNLGVQEKLLLERDKQLDAELKTARAELSNLNGKLAVLRAAQDADEVDFSSLGAFPQGTYPADLMSELAKIKGERIQLEMASGGRDQRRLDENRRRLETSLRLLQSSVESIVAEHAALVQSKEVSLQSVRSELAKLQDQRTAWADLKRKADLLETDYKFYQHEFERSLAASLMQSKQISSVKIIQRPMDPVRPAGIRKLSLVVVAAVLSMFVAVAWASVVEFFDRRIYSTSRVARLLGVPVAGAIPRMRRRELGRCLGGAASRA
jgi:uncharacterized protein involved in exopolysaccharide biosynthesis